jgi:hypothetical protein
VGIRLGTPALLRDVPEVMHELSVERVERELRLVQLASAMVWLRECSELEDVDALRHRLLLRWSLDDAGPRVLELEGLAARPDAALELRVREELLGTSSPAAGGRAALDFLCVLAAEQGARLAKNAARASGPPTTRDEYD